MIGIQDLIPETPSGASDLVRAASARLRDLMVMPTEDSRIYHHVAGAQAMMVIAAHDPARERAAAECAASLMQSCFHRFRNKLTREQSQAFWYVLPLLNQLAVAAADRGAAA